DDLLCKPLLFLSFTGAARDLDSKMDPSVLRPAVQLGISDGKAQLLCHRANQLLIVGADRPRHVAAADEDSEDPVIEHQRDYSLEQYLWIAQEAFGGSDLNRRLHPPVCGAEITDDAFVVKPLVAIGLMLLRS